MSMIYRLGCLSLAAALVAGPAPTAAQSPPADDYTFFDTLDVEVVNVEVVVVDRDGQPVRGLTRDDFELTEDGVPVTITNFYSVEPEPIVGVPPERADPAAPAPPAADARPADQELHLAIFVDGTTLEPINRRRVFDAVAEFFRSAGARPASLVLATYDGSLQVTSLPEFEPADLESHLERLQQAATRGAIGEMERRALLSDLERAVTDPELIGSEALRLFGAIETYADQRFNQVRLSTQALESFVEAMAGLPGRKALLYVSGGLERNPGEAIYWAWDSKFGDLGRQLGINVSQKVRELDTTPELLRLIEHANANRVTFYTVGAGRGGRPGGSVSAEEGSFDIQAMSVGSGGGRNWSAGVEAIDNANVGGTLQELAAATGGLSMTSSRNYDILLSAMDRDLASYYSLGYTPERERDGKSHRIRVRVVGGDFQVRHREHYRARTREEVMAGRTRSAALLGSPANPLEVVMEFGREATEKKNQLLVPVIVKVPLANLVLLPQEEVHVGRIGIFVCARDDKGRTSPVQSIDVPIRIPNDELLTALGQVAGYRMMLQMRATEHQVAVGVRDELGRVESTVTARWQPAAPAT